jgi:hypothetical protein
MSTKTLKLMALACCLTSSPAACPGEHPEAVQEALEGARERIKIEQMQAILSKFTPQMYGQLFEAARESPPAERYYLIHCLLTGYPGHEERRRAGVATRHIIHYLVGHLSDGDASFTVASIRNLSCSELYHGVPDVSLRDFAQEILEAMRRHPETEYAPRLVGKLGFAAARDLLKIPEVVAKMTPQEPVPKGEDRNIAYEARRIQRLNLMKILDVEAALARLGDRDLEWKFIEGFRNRTKEDRWMWLQYLGYIGSPGCVVELARGFLEEPYYPSTGADRPVWQWYAAAFHEALAIRANLLVLP